MKAEADSTMSLVSKSAYNYVAAGEVFGMKHSLFTAFILLLSFAPFAWGQEKLERSTSSASMVPLGFLIVPIHDKQGDVPVRCVGSAEDFSDFGGIEKECDTIIIKPSPDEAMPRHADIYNLVFVSAGISAADPQLEQRLHEARKSARRMVISCRYHGDSEACAFLPTSPPPSAMSGRKEGDQSSKMHFAAELDGQTLWWVALDTGRRTKCWEVRQSRT